MSGALLVVYASWHRRAAEQGQMRVWLDRPRKVLPERRPDPFMPRTIVKPQTTLPVSRMFGRPSGIAVRPHDGQAYIPTFGPGQKHGPKIPALPLILYDLGVGEGGRGRGAPIVLRTFVEAILYVSTKDRNLVNRKSGTVLELPLSLRQYVLGMFGTDAKGKLQYRADRHWPALERAFEVLRSAEAWIPWEDPDTKRGGKLHIVEPVVIPRSGYNLDDWLVLGVRLPPGSEKGPLIDRSKLRLAGRKSAPAYRLLLGLSFMWAQPGKMMVRAGRKGPYRQVRKESRYPPVSDADLVAMAYPVGGSVTKGTYRKRLHDAKKALTYLEWIGFCKRLPNGSIMPGLEWAGWPDE